MSRLDEVLKLQTLDEGAKQELKDADEVVGDLSAISQVAQSEGGKVMLELLKDDCSELLIAILGAKKEGNSEVVNNLLSDFEATYTLYNTIKSASKDHTEAFQALKARMDEIIDS